MNVSPPVQINFLRKKDSVNFSILLIKVTTPLISGKTLNYSRHVGLSSVDVPIERVNPRTMTLKYVSAASSTGRRKLGVNYIAAVNSSELKLTMLQRPFHGAPASACNPSVFINPGLSEAASGLATTLFVEPVSPKCQPTCEFLSYTISIYVLRRIDTYLIFIRYSLLKLNWIEFLEEKKRIHVRCCCPLLSDRKYP